jgi:polyhydroxyalkanoic acid synthase PhaR subunit
MSQKSENSNPFDPTGMFKNMRDAGMDTWSKMMIQMVNSEAYAQATATVLDAWLTTSAPFRTAVASTMSQVLTQLNMPTRTDVTSLAERLTHIEMRLDDLEAKFDDRSQPAPKAAPGKTKETTG